MFNLGVTIYHNGEKFSFSADIKRGEIFSFDIGEKVLADKLFYCLVGLEKCENFEEYKKCCEEVGVNLGFNKGSNILALGDNSMFLNSSVYKNIYRVIRVRSGRKRAKEMTKEILELYGLEGRENICLNKGDKESGKEILLKTAVARSCFRDIRLVIVNTVESYINSAQEFIDLSLKDFTEDSRPYIIEIR